MDVKQRIIIYLKLTFKEITDPPKIFGSTGVIFEGLGVIMTPLAKTICD